MSDKDIYAKVSAALSRSLDYHVIDTEDGIAIIGNDYSQVWLVVVNEATLDVSVER